MSTSDKNASHQKVKEQTDEVEDKVSNIYCCSGKDSRHGFEGSSYLLILVEPVRSVLRTHATRLTFIGENKELDKFIEEKISELKTNYPTLGGILERIHKMD